jgi:hypothetical protein
MLPPLLSRVFQRRGAGIFLHHGANLAGFFPGIDHLQLLHGGDEAVAELFIDHVLRNHPAGGGALLPCVTHRRRVGYRLRGPTEVRVREDYRGVQAANLA